MTALDRRGPAGAASGHPRWRPRSPNPRGSPCPSVFLWSSHPNSRRILLTENEQPQLVLFEPVTSAPTLTWVPRHPDMLLRDALLMGVVVVEEAVPSVGLCPFDPLHAASRGAPGAGTCWRCARLPMRSPMRNRTAGRAKETSRHSARPRSEPPHHAVRRLANHPTTCLASARSPAHSQTGSPQRASLLPSSHSLWLPTPVPSSVDCWTSCRRAGAGQAVGSRPEELRPQRRWPRAHGRSAGHADPGCPTTPAHWLTVRSTLVSGGRAHGL